MFNFNPSAFSSNRTENFNQANISLLNCLPYLGNAILLATLSVHKELPNPREYLRKCMERPDLRPTYTSSLRGRWKTQELEQWLHESEKRLCSIYRIYLFLLRLLLPKDTDKTSGCTITSCDMLRQIFLKPLMKINTHYWAASKRPRCVYG